MTDIPLDELENMIEWFRETAEDNRKKAQRATDTELEAAYRGKADGCITAANRLSAKRKAHKQKNES